ncbi:hypothetical protein C8R46DRAFT_1125609 [Mycena filopes]|nr:hypothetical protein C8R46DRAFT_1125609 [Mycena filopes]
MLSLSRLGSSIQPAAARAHIADLDNRIATLQDASTALSVERYSWECHLDASIYPFLNSPNQLAPPPRPPAHDTSQSRHDTRVIASQIPERFTLASFTDLSSGVVEPRVVRTRIADIDTRIVALQESIQQLSLERNSWKTHLDAYSYPVLTLPNELVSEIFLHTRVNFPRLSTLKAPLLLSWICRHWREIALSMPAFWDTLSITPPQNISDHPAKLPMLETWLRRAGNRPLFLALSFRRLPAPPAFSMRHFLEGLLLHRSRWEYLSLDVPFGDLHLLRGDMPSLRVLSLSVRNVDVNALGNAPVSVFDCAPKLEKVSIHAQYGTLLVLPWRQLKSLVLSAMCPYEVSDILRQTINLSSLAVDFTAADDEDVIALLQPTPIPPLLYLSDLDVDSTDSEALVQFLDRIALPRLTNLSILSTRDVQPSMVAELVARSACNMQALRIEIDSWEHTEADYRALLPTVGTIVINLPVVETFDEDSEDEDQDEVGEENGDEDGEEDT